MHFSHCRFSFSRKAPLELSFFVCATIAVIVKKILQPLRVSWLRCIFLTLPYKGTVHSKMKQSLQKHKMALWGSSCVIEDSGSPKLHKWILKDIIYTFFRVKFNLQLQGKVCKGVHNIFSNQVGIYVLGICWMSCMDAFTIFFFFSFLTFSFFYVHYRVNFWFPIPTQQSRVRIWWTKYMTTSPYGSIPHFNMIWSMRAKKSLTDKKKKKKMY